MDAIKLILSLLIFTPMISYSQKSIYPKDTIYIKYEDKKEDGWNAKFERSYNNDRGLYFNVEQDSGDMALFYPYTEKADTLCIESLNNYHFSDLEEIKEKEKDWVEKRYKNLKYKPYTGSKNAVFHTYVIELISDKKIVKYPVIWRNERI